MQEIEVVKQKQNTIQFTMLFVCGAAFAIMFFRGGWEGAAASIGLSAMGIGVSFLTLRSS